ncbi:hypothetical protein PS619_04956 [Pseudomonas fluorescens]|nr:hypothetical protein PS619_04956 [Pseudomonas fluorescens]
MSWRAILCVRFGIRIWLRAFGLGGLWADHALGVWGVYPFFRVLRLAVSLLQRVTFSKRRKGNPKGFALTFGPSLELGVPSFRDRSGGIAYGLLRCTSSRCVRLRRTVAALPPPDQSLHSACRRASRSRSKAAAELTLILLSGEKRMWLLLLFCRSEPARDGGLTADQYLPDVHDPCGSEPAREEALSGNAHSNLPTFSTPPNAKPTAITTPHGGFTGACRALGYKE